MRQKNNIFNVRFIIGVLCLFLLVGATAPANIPINVAKDLAVSYQPNAPIGTPIGAVPGRVSWMYDPKAAKWDGKTGSWWEDKNTDIKAVESMLSNLIKNLANKTTIKEAWDTLFRSYNIHKTGNDIGYEKGDKVFIKFAMPNGTDSNNIAISPQLFLALVRQLINEAGVDPEHLIVSDPANSIPDSYINPCKAEFPTVDFYHKGNVNWLNNLFAYSVPNTNGKAVPKALAESIYVINLSVLKADSAAGVYLTAKNFHGCVDIMTNDKLGLGPNQYSILADYLGFMDFGGKTMLYIVDALYGHTSETGVPTTKWKMAPFNNNWPSSIFVSQDPVAIDSVCYDFLDAEWGTAIPNIKNGGYYLHEAALANNAPSGTVYDPEQDTITCESLGTHEHWNNATDKKYSKNLSSSGKGIELTQLHSTEVNLALKGIAISSSDYLTFVAKNAIDGNPETIWGTLKVTPPAPPKPYLVIDLQAKKVITKVVLRWYSPFFANKFILGVSNGTDWIMSGEITGDGKDFVLDTKPYGLNHRYIGISMVSPNGTQIGYALREFEVWGQQ